MKRALFTIFLLGVFLVTVAASTVSLSEKEQSLIGCYGSGYPTTSCVPGTKVTYHKPGVLTGHGADINMEQGWIAVENTTCPTPEAAKVEICEYKADFK